MNTININELDISPKIAESKEFSFEEIAELVDQVTKYVEEKFPGVYNPMTIQRLVMDQARFEDGTTRKQKFETEIENDRQASVEREVEREGRVEDVYKKYQPEKDALEAEIDEGISKHVDTYSQKKREIPEGENMEQQLKDLEKEQYVAFDDFQWSNNKKRDELNSKIEKEVLGA